jgi:hypothetical protein
VSKNTMNDEFSDYDGPTGLFIATGEEMLPLNTPEALAALGHSAMLLSLGASPQAEEYEHLVKQLARVA